MIDLGPAATRTAELVTSVTDEQLTLPTPCPEMCVGDVIDHIGAFAVGFVAVAEKDIPGTKPPAPADVAHLGDGWRERISADLVALAEAWRHPRAWQGDTAAGGIDLPGEVAGLVAVDELICHGWDVAVATGQDHTAEPEEVEAALGFVASFDAPRDGQLFGPVVPVDDDADPLQRLLGLAGRDPAWQPPA